MSRGDLFVSDDEEVEIKQEQKLTAGSTTEHAVEDPNVDSYNDNEDDDPVVEELPVYASTTGPDLHLYQYPTRSAKLPFVDATGSGIYTGRIKPNSQHVAVDVPIGHAQFYDVLKGEKWDHVDRQTMAGVLKQSQGTYLIGVLDGGALHVNEVSAVAQLRPQFNYFDRTVMEEREAFKSTRDAVNNSLNTGKVTTEPRAIQMSAKSTNDFAPKFSGALSAKKIYDEEAHEELDWYDRDSAESRSIRSKLVAAETEPLGFIGAAKEEYTKAFHE